MTQIVLHMGPAIYAGESNKTYVYVHAWLSFAGPKLKTLPILYLTISKCLPYSYLVTPYSYPAAWVTSYFSNFNTTQENTMLVVCQ